MHLAPTIALALVEAHRSDLERRALAARRRRRAHESPASSERTIPARHGAAESVVDGRSAA